MKKFKKFPQSSDPLLQDGQKKKIPPLNKSGRHPYMPYPRPKFSGKSFEPVPPPNVQSNPRSNPPPKIQSTPPPPPPFSNVSSGTGNVNRRYNRGYLQSGRYYNGGSSSSTSGSTCEFSKDSRSFRTGNVIHMDFGLGDALRKNKGSLSNESKIGSLSGSKSSSVTPGGSSEVSSRSGDNSGSGFNRIGSGSASGKSFQPREVARSEYPFRKTRVRKNGSNDVQPPPAGVWNEQIQKSFRPPYSKTGHPQPAQPSMLAHPPHHPTIVHVGDVIHNVTNTYNMFYNPTYNISVELQGGSRSVEAVKEKYKSKYKSKSKKTKEKYKKKNSGLKNVIQEKDRMIYALHKELRNLQNEHHIQQNDLEKAKRDLEKKLENYQQMTLKELQREKSFQREKELQRELSLQREGPLQREKELQMELSMLSLQREKELQKKKQKEKSKEILHYDSLPSEQEDVDIVGKKRKIDDWKVDDSEPAKKKRRLEVVKKRKKRK